MAGTRLELHHQYPWRRQEIITLVVLAAVPCVFAALLLRGHASRGTLLAVVLPAAGVCWGIGLYALNLGITRKRRSRITGTLDGTMFAFSGGRFRRSRGDLAGHERVALRRNGREEALVLSTRSGPQEPDTEVVVPLRLVRPRAGGHDELAQQLRQATTGCSLTPEAQAVIEML